MPIAGVRDGVSRHLDRCLTPNTGMPVPSWNLVDGRIICNIEDAMALAREQETRTGVDRRDEVLHSLERAPTAEEAYAAAHLFLGWVEELFAEARSSINNHGRFSGKGLANIPSVRAGSVAAIGNPWCPRVGAC